MRRRVLLCLTLISAMSACNGDRVGTPIGSAAKPSNDISDGTHTGDGLASNRDFFFLPPMVKSPSGSTYWDAGAFNPNLRPIVEICDFGPAVSTVPAGLTCTGTTLSYATEVSITDEHYKVNWKVPTSATKFYRISVRLGNTRLGYADVESGANGASLKNVDTQDFVPLVDGSTLPIKFRIERYALCAVPGVGPCTSVSADISVAPLTASIVLTEATQVTSSGVTIPVQTNLTSPTPVTATLAACDNLNPTVLDLPTFGPCVRVTTDPDVGRLAQPATVFVCAQGLNASIFTGLSPEQEKLATLHRYDATGPRAGVTALPHATACSTGAPGGLAMATPTVGGILSSLSHGDIKRAAGQAVAWLAPKPLYAAMYIDLGVGGLTEFFSDFQFALPAKMNILAGSNNLVVAAGTVVNPTVEVTDLTGSPVNGVSLKFNTSTGVTQVVTAGAGNLAGRATIPWTIVAGSNALTVTGRGVASPGTNGPRGSIINEVFRDDVIDPFQPIQAAYPGTGTSGEVIVHTGSVAFSATGRVAGSVLIYGPSLFSVGTTGLSNEETLALGTGKSVVVWNATTWPQKNKADFAQFDAIIFGDNNCAASPDLLGTANNNKEAWSAAVRGPVVIIGTDPVYHQDRSQALQLITNGIKFAASNPNATGLYVSLSCYYANASATAPAPVSFLSEIGNFRVVGQSGLTQAVSINSLDHPVMADLTPTGLSNWNISVHEAFPTLASFPGGYDVLATVAPNTPGEGLAYIIARNLR